MSNNFKTIETVHTVETNMVYKVAAILKKQSRLFSLKKLSSANEKNNNLRRKNEWLLRVVCNYAFSIKKIKLGKRRFHATAKYVQSVKIYSMPEML